MKAIAIFFAASVLVVFSSPPEQPDDSVKKARAFYYYQQQTLPMTQFYDNIPLVSYHPFYSYPSMQIEPASNLTRASAVHITEPAVPIPRTPLIDENVSDDEAMKQLETLKRIYAQNSESGVVLPSIVASSRGLVLVKNSSFISFLNSISLASIAKTKTKYYIVPSVASKTKTKTYLFPTFGW